MSAAHPQTGSAALSVSELHCINLRGRLEACDLCQRACHARAITLTLDEVTIDPALCTGCGACVPACPAGAITHDRFEPEEMIATAVSGEGVARIACAQAGTQAGGQAAQVPCHRMLDARLMAALLAEGAQRIEVLGTESCPGCPGGDARPALKAAERTLNKWFGEAAPRLVLAGAGEGLATAGTAEARRAVARRSFLRGAFGALSEPSGRASEPLAPSRAVPSFDAILAREDTGADTAGRPIAYQQALATRRLRLPFGETAQVGATGRTIDEACNGCLVCAELCPTGALGAEISPGHRLVSFDPAICTNCTLCLKVCPMEAISARVLRGVAQATAGREVLFARDERICPECGGGFDASTGAAICPSCENDRELDDEWLEMLSG